MILFYGNVLSVCSMGEACMPDVYLFDFSGIYSQKTFWIGKNIMQIDFRDIPGTNCYCDDIAAEEILRRTKNISGKSLRFLDSGNYHYLSFLLAGNFQMPFNMLVFDHHTDMQPPQFGDILSCGGWIRRLILEHPYLRKLVLIGPPRSDYAEAEDDLKQNIIFVSQEQEKEAEDVIRGELQELPLYISVDKDVLANEYAETAWTQGSMSDEILMHLLDTAVHTVRAEKILAVDVCGEQPLDSVCYPDPNDRMNSRILNWFRGLQNEK